jgi:hypothetical protein
MKGMKSVKGKLSPLRGRGGLFGIGSPGLHPGLIGLDSFGVRADTGVRPYTNAPAGLVESRFRGKEYIHKRDACASASVSGFGRRGASPLQAVALRPVTDRHCVAARRGGEPREVSDRSVTPAGECLPQ